MSFSGSRGKRSSCEEMIAGAKNNATIRQKPLFILPPSLRELGSIPKSVGNGLGAPWPLRIKKGGRFRPPILEIHASFLGFQYPRCVRSSQAAAKQAHWPPTSTFGRLRLLPCHEHGGNSP